MIKTLLRSSLFLAVTIPFSFQGMAQSTQPKKKLSDTLTLDSVMIRDSKPKHLADIDGTYIFAGKKTYSVRMEQGKGNLASNNVRTSLATVPGLNIWEMSGNSLQLSIGTRGTDSHRSDETNIRQNGYNTNSDIFGYPENHYAPQFAAVDEIQIVRGSAALQFGSQFGGMVNFKMKEGDTTKVLSVESEQTTGSQKYFNSFNSVGGKSGKWTYYGYFAARSGNGWRESAAYSSQWFYGNVKYQFNRKGSIALQFSRINYREQAPGGLTDAQFADDPRQATRSRNFFSPEINIPALIFNYQLAQHTKLEVTANTLLGQRNSIQYLNSPGIADTINKATNSYNARQVDRDYYYAFTTEARLLHSYKLGNLNSTLTGGLRYFSELTHRQQKAKGDTGSDYNLDLVGPYGIDLRFHSHNYAAFAENLFQITPKFSVTPGARFEVINTDMTGVINNAKDYREYHNNRTFPLFGTGLQYQLSPTSQLYGNVSQAFKPFYYASIIPGNDLAIIDPNLKDSKGYDADLGYRGNIGSIFNYDFNLYYVYYGDRAGNLTKVNAANQTYIYTTNIGNGSAKGAEVFTEVSLLRSFDRSSLSDIRLFNSFSYDHARYTSGTLSNGTTNVSLKGNWLEGTPTWINRTGLTYVNSHITTTLQYSYVGKSFTDANNTVFNATGLSGVVPAYHIMDWSFNYSFLKRYHIYSSINNLLDAKYFTRRITVLPGPGILPGDGITFNVGFGIKI